MAKKQKNVFSLLNKTKVTYKILYFNVNEIYTLYGSREIIVDESDGNIAQREYEEWDKEKLYSFLKILENGYPPQQIYLVKVNGAYHVIDGQHRIKSIVALIDNKNITSSSKIPLFPFVFIESKEKSFSKLQDWASDLFIMINTTADKVKDARILRLGIRSKFMDVYEYIKKDYKKAFKISSIDHEYIISANIIYILGNDEKKYKESSRHNENLISFITNDQDNDLAHLADDFKSFFSWSISNGFYGNKDNKKNKKPENQIIFAFILSFKRNKEKFLKIANDDIVSILDKLRYLLENENFKSYMTGKRGQFKPFVFSQYIDLFLKKKEEGSNEFEETYFDGQKDAFWEENATNKNRK